MDEAFAKQLCQLNNRFYEQNAASFSATRQSGWPGWGKCLDVARPNRQTQTQPNETGNASKPPNGQNKLYLVDLACGNLRFEAFLERAMPQARLSALAMDACEGLPVARSDTRFLRCDIIEELSKEALGEALGKALGISCADGSFEGADMAVCFGFMHHIPLPEWREQLLEAMLGAVKPGGFVCASFWRFADDEGLAEKAQRTHAQGCLELGFNPAAFNEGDFLLGWKNREGSYRYCHSFTDTDIDELAASLPPSTRTAARFRADGRTGNLNEYLVLQRL